MIRDHRRPAPRTYFLNEQHELTRTEKEAGGSLPKLVPIDWAAKGRQIHDSLRATRDQIGKSDDPLRTSRFFLATVPTPKIKKYSKNLKRAPTGIVEEEIDYAGDHSRVFKRLGLDLLAVGEGGRALIHAPASRFEQLLATTTALPEEGLREQARWIAIDSFELAPASFRIDQEWLDRVPQKASVDAVVEL